MNADTELYDQLNSAPGTKPWTAKMSDVYAPLKDKSVSEILEDSEVHVSPAGPKVPIYTQLRDQIGENLAALETALSELLEAITPVLTGFPAEPLKTPEAPTGSQIATDLTIVRDRIAELAHQAHDAKARVEV